MARKPKTYEGDGRTLDEALRQAARKAEKDIRYPDGVVEWKLTEVRGSVGGITGGTFVHVTIEFVR